MENGEEEFSGSMHIWREVALIGMNAMQVCEVGGDCVCKQGF